MKKSKLEEDILKLKDESESLRKSAIGIKDNTIYLCGVYFHTYMNVTMLNDKDLILGHTLLHKNYSEKKPKLPKDWIIKIHTLFVQEFQNRGKKHFKFDKLDDLGGKN